MKLYKPDPKAIELPAVTLTALLKFILLDRLGMRAFYIGGICLFWLSYFIYRYSLDHSVLLYWGFKRENFKKSLLALLPYLILCVCITVIYGVFSQVRMLNPHMIPILILYPVWGIVQQFMLVGILAESLQSIRSFSLNKYSVILLTSSIFSLVHYPGLILMAFTFAMEVVFLTVYLKWRNLWAIGIAHGWIATFLIYYVLHRDLWTELFAWF